MGPCATRGQVCESPALRLQIGFFELSLYLTQPLIGAAMVSVLALQQDFVSQEAVSMCIVLFLFWQRQKTITDKQC